MRVVVAGPVNPGVPKALRVLADRDYVHARYYGVATETDYQV